MRKGTFKDISNQRFGRLVVLEQAPNRVTTSGRFALTYWRCRCDCGTIKNVRAASLFKGKSKSCGCLRAEMWTNMLTHGHSHSKNGHASAEYQCWTNMLNRCRNSNIPGFENYGGRGITVCERWRSSFENFLVDMGNRPSTTHSLDRIDVNKSYSPENCRWSTAQEQVSNRRKMARIEEFTTEELIAELNRRTL